MRLLHTADWHLGHRRFTRLAPNGVNQHELDIERSLTNLVDAAIICQPDVMVIAGDNFDRVRPPNRAVVHALTELSRLRAALPNTIVVMISGNHCSARQTESGCILPVFRSIGVHVVDREAQRLSFADRDLSILCVPDAPGVGRPELQPNPDARYNVLLMHAEASGVKQGGAEWRPRITDVTPDELAAPEWDYVALGHYHQLEQIADNAWYSGSIDYVSSDIWLESKGPPKGLIVRDLEDGHQEFVELPPTRRIIDLPLLYGQDKSAGELDAMIATAMESIEGGYDHAVVRQVVAGVTRDSRLALDHQAIRRYLRRCLSFTLDPRKPERALPGEMLLRAGGKRRSLEDVMAERFADVGKTPLPPEVDRADFLARAHQYVVDAYGPEAAGPAPDQWISPTPEPKAVESTAGAAA